MGKLVEDVLSSYPGAATSSLSSAVAEAAPSDGVDRISALPDDLLRDVVSRLPARDGARTAALASRWRGLWRSAPLVLRDSDFLLASEVDDDSARAAAAAAIGRVLADHPGPFRKVQLTCCVFASQGRELAEWARLLAAKCVRDLVLVDLESYFPGVERPLPDDILSCASLHRLFLGYCIFPDTTAVVHRGNDVVFPLLKDLVMHKTDMRDQDLEHMLACSPKLKRLALISISRLPQRIRLCGPNLQCMFLWMSLAEELAVVDAPRLERLILWKPCAGNESGDNMVVKIDQKASELHVLGYLEPRVHQLQIGNVIINAQTKASSSSIVASVKILALKVNLGVFKDVNMLLAFLECFPNIETLHIESSILGEPTGTLHAKFWPGVRPIECLKAHVKKIVIHEFRGDRSEFQFLMFIAMRVEKLQFLLPVLTKEKSTSTDEVDEVSCQLKILFASIRLWATEECQVLLMGPEKKNALSFPRASDLSINDPFM